MAMRSDPNNFDIPYATGGNDLAIENTFTWVSGAAWNAPTSMWRPGMPDNHLNNQHCVWITLGPFLDDYDCSTPIDFICEYV